LLWKSAALSNTRTSCLPLISPNEPDTSEPSGDTSMSYMSVPYGHVITRSQSVYGGFIRTRVDRPFRCRTPQIDWSFPL
jgi:hypothetical protein